MSRDLRDLLEQTAHEPVGLPTIEDTWAAGRSRQRVRRLATAAGSAVAIGAVALAGLVLIGDPAPGPEIVDRPPGTSEPEPSEATGSEVTPDGPAAAMLDRLAVASTMSLDDGGTYESQFPDGTVVRAVDGAAYPARLHGLADGTVAWQTDAGIHVLGPQDDVPTTLVPTPTDPASHINLVGTGERDGESMVLVDQGRAASPQDDDGGTLSAHRLDGTSEILLEFAGAWEYGITAATYHDEWLLYTDDGAGFQQTVLRAPDGDETVIQESSEEGGTLQSAAIAELDIAPGLALVEHHVDHGDPDAPFGAGRLEIRSVDDAAADEPAWTIDLPTDNVPKQLVVAGALAYLTLLPDAPELLQVDLSTGEGEIDRFSAPGIVAVHSGLYPRPPDAPPPAACAESSGDGDADAQPYVWLPCAEAATSEEGDSPAEFLGIHRLRPVTDPRASSGGVAQRIEAMLDAIFAGPTPEEQAAGYGGIIDPDVDALVGVTFQDGVATVELSEPGARAAHIGTYAAAVFQATLEAAVFGGFLDVDALRITVEGDCAAWSTYGEGEPICPTYHRDGGPGFEG